MQKEKLTGYILKQLAKSRDIVEIREELKDVGWKKEDVDNAINSALKEKRDRISLGSIKKMGLIFINPTEFFLNIKFEGTLKKSILFLIINSFILIAGLIVRWAIQNITVRSSFGMVVLFLSPLILILGEIFILLFVSFFSFLTFIFTKLFGNKLSFPFTFKVCAYAIAPLLLSLLSYNTKLNNYIIIPLWFWSMALTAFGIEEINGLSFIEGFLSVLFAYGSIYGIILLISAITSTPILNYFT